MSRQSFFFSCFFLLVGCNQHSIKSRLDAFEDALETNPKATYALLKDIHPGTKEDIARHTILLIKAKNLAYITLEEKDTIDVLNAINYYRKHRDTEYIMQGYYLLGSIYRDLGDAPRGVEAFHRVIEVADTLNKDCDYRLMARAEGQKSDLQSSQNILAEALNSSNRAEYYSWKARDTTYALDCAFESIGINALRQNYHPLVDLAPMLIDYSISVGDTLLAVRKMVGLAWDFLQINKIEEASKMIELYNLYNGRPYPMYYGTKGELFLALHLPDSAEWCFRKELEATDWNNRQTAYRGLKKAFEQRHQTDSALKYATLQCEAVDSDYKQKVSEDIVRMEQVYNYEAEKEKVRKSESKQQRLKWIAGLAGLLTLIMALVSYFSFRLLHERHRRKLLIQKSESERLMTLMAEQEMKLAREEKKREEAEGRVAQMETNVLEINTELRQLEQEREEMQHTLDTLQGNSQRNDDAPSVKPERIKDLEELLNQKEMDIQDARNEVERQKQDLLAQQKMIDEMQITIEAYREESRSMENLGDGVQQMRQRVKEHKPATVRNWMAMQKQVLKLHPMFIKSMRQSVPSLLEGELRVAMLIKMGFLPSEIALLMDRSPQMVSMTRRRLFMKANGRTPADIKDVDEWIKGV